MIPSLAIAFKGTGFDSSSEYQPVNWPEAFEAGTHNVPGIISMGEGLKFINETGIKNIAERELYHIERLWEYLHIAHINRHNSCSLGCI